MKCKPVNRPTPPHLKCARCCHILVNPCKTACGHIFCEECIAIQVNATSTCFTCHAEMGIIKPAPSSIYFQIGALSVYCPYNGCNYIGPYSEFFETHAKVCNHRTIKCFCGEVIKQEKTHTHVDFDHMLKLNKRVEELEKKIVDGEVEKLKSKIRISVLSFSFIIVVLFLWVLLIRQRVSYLIDNLPEKSYSICPPK